MSETNCICGSAFAVTTHRDFSPITYNCKNCRTIINLYPSSKEFFIATNSKVISNIWFYSTTHPGFDYKFVKNVLEENNFKKFIDNIMFM